MNLFSTVFLTVLSFVSPQFDEDQERNYHPSYASQATGNYQDFEKLNSVKAPWPVKVLSIGHTNGSYQKYGSEAYFHHGLDIRADAGSDVLCARGGKVINIENYMPSDAYWEVAILDADGFIWQYHHINHSSIPKNVLDAFKNKTEIPDGTKIGEVYYWGIVTFGERYHHIHLNVLGKNKEYLSPFMFLEDLSDKQSPTFGEISLFQNEKKINGNKVSGNYTLVAELKDLIQSEVFIVPPHEIKIKVDTGDWKIVWSFVNLPGGSSNTDYVDELYVPSLVCGNYSCRKPIVDLGFEKGSHHIFPLTKGKHQIRIETADYNGNSSYKEYEWEVD